ncbi:RNA polymerase sigma-70 factor [Parabacteroides sp. AF48-14]|uniref:RNA polymerase sigma-70 factor n=1 Tax=Parabacteroides sp. AF48-14 TaxID=2292052 RepID=UPI000EFF4444|nr:RNA polymerase sigma-70 factor [Parabacteroides sp. AF48-14]RHO65814.1 RNA polymerase sigma-70 factor [Parabacteroides sp. AF48-14]
MKNINTPNVDHLLWSISVNDDEAAYRSLFEHYYAALCLFAKRYIEDRDVREDIVQDVFFNIWEKRKSITANISARNYLVTSVKNLSLNYLRKQSYIQEYQNKIIENPPLYSNGEEDLYTLNELEALLAKTLEKLPPEYRMAFEMSRMEQKSMEEIAEIMGVSIRTVERYRNKALEILKKELKDYLPLLLLLLNN